MLRKPCRRWPAPAAARTAGRRPDCFRPGRRRRARGGLRHCAFPGVSAGRRHEPARHDQHSPRPYLVMGFAAAFLLVAGVGGWAATDRSLGRGDRAGQARRRFEREEGPAPDRRRRGRAARADGDQVKTGDLLVRLDETVRREPTSAIVIKASMSWRRRQARLEAERDDARAADLSGGALRRAAPTRPLYGPVSGEDELFELRRGARAGRRPSCHERSSSFRTRSGHPGAGSRQGEGDRAAQPGARRRARAVEARTWCRSAASRRSSATMRRGWKASGRTGRHDRPEPRAKSPNSSFRSMQIDQDLQHRGRQGAVRDPRQDVGV